MRLPWWRSTAVPALPVLVAAGSLFLLQRGTPWRGEWLWTVDWACGATVLLAPLVAGCAAHDAALLRTDGMLELRRSCVRGPRGVLGPVAAAGAVGTAVLLGIVLTALVLTATTGPTGTPPLQLVPVAVQALVTAAAVGAVVGSRLPVLVAAPVAGAAVYVVSILSARGTVPDLFRVGGSTGTLTGLAWDRWFLLWLTGALLAWSLTGLAVAARSSLVGPRRTTTLGLLVVALVAVGTTTALAHRPDRFVPRAVELRCEGERPRVCVASTSTRSLDSLVRRTARLDARLRAAGVSTVPVVAQVVPGHRPSRSAGALFIESSDVNRPTVPWRTAARYLTTPTPCPGYTASTPPPGPVFEAQAALAAWLEMSVGAGDARSWRGAPWHDWLTASPSRQRAWLVRTYDQLRRCDLEAVRAP
ncbi:MAG: hypothetical protein PGN07_03540 [Aeromicrobium erythreum]